MTIVQPPPQPRQVCIRRRSRKIPRIHANPVRHRGQP